MFQRILNWFIPPVEIVSLDLKKVEQEQQNVVFDRNYHHYVITEHTQQRMKERKISYAEIKMALKYGEETKDGVVLRITQIPEEEFKTMENADIKAITYLLPLTVIINKKDKVIKTVYPNNKIYLKERVFADSVRKHINNRYTRKLKDKIKDGEKQKKKLAKKLRPYKEIDTDYA